MTTFSRSKVTGNTNSHFIGIYVVCLLVMCICVYLFVLHMQSSRHVSNLLVLCLFFIKSNQQLFLSNMRRKTTSISANYMVCRTTTVLRRHSTSRCRRWSRACRRTSSRRSMKTLDQASTTTKAAATSCRRLEKMTSLARRRWKGRRRERSVRMRRRPAQRTWRPLHWRRRRQRCRPRPNSLRPASQVTAVKGGAKHDYWPLLVKNVSRVSQGRASTHLRCGGTFTDFSLQNLLMRYLVKKFWNQLSFAEFTDKNTAAAFWLATDNSSVNLRHPI